MAEEHYDSKQGYGLHGRLQPLQRYISHYSIKSNKVPICLALQLYLMLLRQPKLIPGLSYLPNFITPPQKARILEIIHSNSWCSHLKRHQQYYGIKYFQTKIADHVLQPQSSQDHLPLHLFQFLINKTVREYSFFREDDPPNQILVNQYFQRDRLGLHVEDKSAFGDVIVGISLGSTDYLRLAHVQDKTLEYKLEIEDRSCYVLSGSARNQWRHGIGRTINREQYKQSDFNRISLTVRHVIDSRRKVSSTDSKYTDRLSTSE